MGLRSCLFIDKLTMVINISFGIISASGDFPEEVTVKIENLMKILNLEFDSLMTWARNPTYSPDHPYGNNIMSSIPFAKHANENDKK